MSEPSVLQPVKSENIELQQKMIAGLEVKPVTELLDPNLQEIYFRNQHLVGKKTIALHDGKYIKLSGASNGIMAVKLLENGQEFDSIKEYFVLDSNNRVGFDLTQLWNEENTGKPVNNIISAPKLVSMYTFSKEGRTLALNDLTDLDELDMPKGLPEKLWPVVEILTHVHEIGHYLQDSRKSPGENSFTQYLRASKEETNKQKRMLFALRILNKIPGAVVLPAITEGQIGKDTTKGLTERNASAFALNIIRNLKNKGIDLSRQVGNKKLSEYLNRALNSLTYI